MRDTEAMREVAAERVAFLRAFVAHPRSVGAILPTSRRAVRVMLDMADVPGARRVVELGAGTGVYTGEILARLGPDVELLALESDPKLADLLGRRFDDPRLRVVCDSAENVGNYLDGVDVDLIVSGLPFTSLGADLRRIILDRSRHVLSADGTMLVLQYSPLLQAELARRFDSVRRRICVLNVPPAFLFACARVAGGPHRSDGDS